MGCGESIKEFLALGFRVRFYGSSVFVTSNDLINRRYKTDAKNRCYLYRGLKPMAKTDAKNRCYLYRGLNPMAKTDG